MQLRAVRILTGALAAMSLSILPAIAQNNMQAYSASSDPYWTQVNALNTFVSEGLTSSEIIAILPLLTDLRDAERALAFTPDVMATSTSDVVSTFRTSHDSIWQTITDRIGSDKVNRLRGWIEPARVDASTFYVKSERITRMENLLSEWDRQSAARIAANGGTNTTQPASITTTTVTTTMTPVWVTTVAPMRTEDLVRVLTMKLAAMESNNDPDAMLYVSPHHDLTAADLAYMRNMHIKKWD
jgi:hypothetical protein